MIQLEDFKLEVWVRDRRFREGERLLRVYRYDNKHQQWMDEEVRDLQSGLYPRNQFRLAVKKSWMKQRSNG